MKHDPSTRPIVAPNDITSALRELGIRRGDRMFVHSSLSAFGHVNGGAEAVVDALLETVAPGGTVAVPTSELPQAGQCFSSALWSGRNSWPHARHFHNSLHAFSPQRGQVSGKVCWNGTCNVAEYPHEMHRTFTG